jgi:predicted nuclease of predicted toxin-antitoxin system
VNFLIDSSLSPLVADRLRWAGHDSVQVRRYGIHKAEDEAIFHRAAEEARVLVSADTTFSALLAARQAAKPSVILFRGESPRRAEAQAALLIANLGHMAELLDQGSMVVFEHARLLSRPLPLLPIRKL